MTIRTGFSLSRRLLGKDEKESDFDMSTQPTKSRRKDGSDEDATKGPVEKKQKMTVKKPATPAKEAPTPTSSPITDDWAATSKSPTTVTSRKDHGRLLPLLMQKGTTDVTQIQAELDATQSNVKALQKVNEELRAEANEAKRAGLGTRPSITRLMRTARTSQGTLIKLIKAIADYQLTHEEKAYLHSLTEGNDKITDQLKQNHPNFFQRIFVDSDKDFNNWAQNVTDTTNALLKSTSISSRKPMKSTKSAKPTQEKSAKRPPPPTWVTPSAQPAKPPPPSSHPTPSAHLAPLARMATEHVTPERSTTATLSADANLMSGALNSSPETSGQVTPSESVRAVPYDLFAAPVVPLGDDFQVEDCQGSSAYDPVAEEDDSDYDPVTQEGGN